MLEKCNVDNTDAIGMIDLCMLIKYVQTLKQFHLPLVFILLRSTTDHILFLHKGYNPEG